MKTNLKLLVQLAAITLLIAVTTAQKNSRNQRKSSSSYRSPKNDEPTEQGRTLGFLRPLLGLGLSAIARPLGGYDAPIVAANRPRPTSGSSSSQSDPYYGYGGYAAYAPNFYNGYNYYGGFPLYRPIFPFYNIYRPPVYPAYYGGFPSQRPVYSRPRPVAQRPLTGQQPAAYPAVSSTVSTAFPSAGATTSPVANSGQAAQIANLLGQLLGQQLRPLLNQGAASPARDEPGIAPEDYRDKGFRN